MEIAVVGRHTEITERFREHAEEKLAKITQLNPAVQRVDVEVTRENNPKLANVAERVELTVRAKGPVVRAEAAADDRFGALDLALDKLLERLRRSRDRRKDHRRGLDAPLIPEPIDLPAPVKSAPVGKPKATAPLVVDGAPVLRQVGDSPVVIRQKLHAAERLSVEDAVDHMEMVGHDFYLFIDQDTGRPSAVYKRKGWTFGVLQLDVTVAD